MAWFDFWRKSPRKPTNRTTPRASSRMYASARGSRLNVGWTASSGSADSELVTSLNMLRGRSRALCRDSSYAKRARTLVTNNVIGTGIGMQAQVTTTRDDLNRRVNDEIEAAWCRWSKADSCHTGGRLSFKALERLLVDEVFEAGEVFVRIHSRAFGNSTVPFALEVIEAERLADQYQFPTGVAPSGSNLMRMGIEVDTFFRPVAYWFMTGHPSEASSLVGQANRVERVPADQIIHLALINRWPQTRGEPWLHAAARALNDMSGYTEAEITRARVQACITGAIETPEDSKSFGQEVDDGSGAVEMEVSPGVYKRLNPGEKLNHGSPSAPNPALDPFMRYMLREVASGVGVSYESISRDYSQSNYSSSRLALLDDRDVWKVLQSWFITDFRERVHSAWLAQAVLAGEIPSISIASYALNVEKYQSVRFKPRGWSWVDPTKEVTAFRDAITAGLTTETDVIAQTANGRDIEDILDERAHELELMRERGLVFETSPEFYTKQGQPPDPMMPSDPNAEDDQNDQAPARVLKLR